MKKIIIVIISLLTIGLLGTAFVALFNGGEQPASTTETEPSTSETSPAGDESAQVEEQPSEEQEAPDTSESQTKTFNISMKSFSYSQTTLDVDAGDTVTINIENEGGTHDFVIDELDVASEVINGGQSTTVTFTVPADASGKTFAFYCSIGNHRQLGMEGQLVVN